MYAPGVQHGLRRGDYTAMNLLCQKLLLFLRSDDGPTAVEYAVLLAVIAIGTLAAMAAFSDRMNNIYTTIAGVMEVF